MPHNKRIVLSFLAIVSRVVFKMSRIVLIKFGTKDCDPSLLINITALTERVGFSFVFVLIQFAQRFTCGGSSLTKLQDIFVTLY